MNVGDKTVLVVVAHPDDETIGAGGAIARHAEEGRKVCVLSMTDGVSARGVGKASKKFVAERNQAATRAAAILGFEWIGTETLPDNALDSVPLLKVVQIIEATKDIIKPTLVYTHFPFDLNVDHRIVAQAVLTAFRPQPGEMCKEIRSFEIASSTDFGAAGAPRVFNPNVMVSIAKTWAKKLQALKAYAPEMRKAPHSRSYKGIEALARLRGASVGVEMAEGFELLRRIE
jgi:LmbE family N-acetylglucosaminyl deacetylase